MATLFSKPTAFINTKTNQRIFIWLPCLFLVIQFPCRLFSQTIKDYQKTKKAIENCPQNVILMPTQSNYPDKPKTTLPVKRIEVRDVREDTNYIGIQIRLYSSWSNKKCRKILFDKPLSVAFAGFINQNEDFPLSASPYSLICFIREFRITQRDSVNNNTKTKLLYNRIALKAETFLVHDNDYFPAFKIDTVALGLIEEVNEFSDIPDVLTAILQKCAVLNIERTTAKNAYTLSSLENRYSKASDKPILNVLQPETGIYTSFDEFINNKPSITKYEVKSDKLSASLYSVSAVGETTLQTKAFGYCDGNIIWLNIANDYYPLIRRQNTFEYIGDYHAINKKRNGYLANAYLDGSSSTNLASSAMTAGLTSLAVSYLNTITTLRGKVIHQLNLETGEIY